MSTCSRTCTRTKWTSATYGRWTFEHNKHGCSTKGKNQWTTSKCSKIGCSKIVFFTTHQETPQIITQPKVVNVHNDDNQLTCSMNLFDNHGDMQP